MAVVESTPIESYCLDLARRAQAASRELVRLSGRQKGDWLRVSARRLIEETESLQQANSLDLARADDFGLTAAEVDRLRLTSKTIQGMSTALEEIAAQAEPIGGVIESSVRPNGLVVNKVRAPIGVVFFIYESRPNVTSDAAAICVKSGNAVILRGGKEAAHSNRAIVDLLVESAVSCGLPEDAIQLVNTSDRAAVGHLLALDQFINVAIPRGGEGLIRRVVAEARMPVIKHYTGNCHVYVDAAADLEMAERIVINSKCHRLGVCNAAESLVVHAHVADEFLPRIGRILTDSGIELRADDAARRYLPQSKPATEADFATEYLGPIISINVVHSLDEAIEHINRFSSQHTESIVTRDRAAAREFAARIDSSAVMINASTRFNDGGEFGMGAEIGISTDKFHARGPCGVNELTTYKYVVEGDGQIRG